MAQNRLQQNNELFEEACGLFGMIEEVSLKCKLLKNQCKSVDADCEFWEDIQDKVLKMQTDLDRYSYRLKEISEELREINGSIFEMDET